MIDLSRVSGLQVSLCTDNCALKLEPGLYTTPAVRRLEDMRDVLQDSTAYGPDELYWMYRDIALPEDRPIIEKLGLRYDITVLRPGKIGREYIKTYGHYHPLKPGTAISYPEVYEVLHGTALYILQKKGACAGRVEQFISVIAEPGDKVVIPPNFGHVTVNIGDEPLVMANWVAREFSSEYEEFRSLRGAAYYAVQFSDGPAFMFNGNYRVVNSISTAKPVDYPQFGLYKNKPMYNLIKEAPEKLDFLLNPEYYQTAFYRSCNGSSDILWRPTSLSTAK